MATKTNEATVLNLFCARTPDRRIWRVHVRPTNLPTAVRQLFDHNSEAYPALLDFDDLDQYMADHDAHCEKRTSSLGDVELTAEGPSASVLGEWLTRAFMSGTRMG